MNSQFIKAELDALAREEIERLYGVVAPDQAMLDAMIGRIKQWPIVQAVLKNAK